MITGLSPLMCWTCMEEIYVKTGDLPPVGTRLKTDGTETAVTNWWGYSLCRKHALLMLKTLSERGSIAGMEDLANVEFLESDPPEMP